MKSNILNNSKINQFKDKNKKNSFIFFKLFLFMLFCFSIFSFHSNDVFAVEESDYETINNIDDSINKEPEYENLISEDSIKEEGKFSSLQKNNNSNSVLLIVGISPSDPFIIANSSQSPKGFSIDLIEEIVKGLNENPNLKETFIIEYYFDSNLENHLESVKTSKVDLGIATTTINSQNSQYNNQESLDLKLSYPLYTSTMGIMIPEDNKLKILPYIFNLETLKFMLIILVLILLYSILIWVNGKNFSYVLDENESKKNTKTKHLSFFDSFKWVISTIIPTSNTYQYNKFYQKNNFGWILTQIIIITGILIFGIIIAKMVSVLTINGLTHSITGPEDLMGKKVIVIEGTQSQYFASEKGYESLIVNDINSAIIALEKNHADAFIHDKPILLFHLKENPNNNLILISTDIKTNNHQILFPKNNKYQDAINLQLLELIQNGKYDEITMKWFGAS